MGGGNFRNKKNPDPFLDSNFTKLFNELYSSLCQYCIKLVHNKDIAEDIVQEQFIYLWENREKLEHIESIEAYLYRSVKNKSINHLKYWFSKNTYPLDTDLIETKQNITPPDPSEILENKELSVIFKKEVEKLPEKCRIIFSLKRFANMTNLEISEKLQISVKTVEAQTTIAIKKLAAVVVAKLDIVLILTIYFIFF